MTNAAHLHLVLNHVPLLGLLFGFLMLLAALWRRSEELTQVSLGIFVLTALATIPVYLAGEGAEEIVEKLPHVAESLIEQHEEAGLISLISIGVLGMIALAGLLLTYRSTPPLWLITVMLVGAIVAGGITVWTANLGGKISHPEIRGDFQPPEDKN